MTTAATVTTFADIQDVVLEDRFTDTAANRNAAKRAINSRYGAIVAAEDWTFRYAVDPVTVTQGSRSVTGLVADFQAILGMWNENGESLNYLPTTSFYNAYQADTTTGSPSGFTVMNGQIIVAPTPSATSSTWQVFYRKRVTLLSDDTDEPILPAEFRYLLVHAARSVLLAAKQDPSWQDEEAFLEEGLAAMRRDYLTDAEGEPSRWPADRTVW